MTSALSPTTEVSLLVDPATVPFGLVSHERDLLSSCSDLWKIGYFRHALLDLWAAAIHNVRRRVEVYSTELFESVVKDEPGRKKLKKDGETINERWEGVDDAVLLTGALRLGILSKKAHKALELINWNRNHASAAHATDEAVERNDVASFASLLEQNLFRQPLPDPGHSVASLFEPIRESLDADQLEALRDQIRAYKAADLRTCFGFLFEKLLEGSEPAASNAQKLFPLAWERSTDELRRTVGTRFHSIHVAKDRDKRSRLLQILVLVQGIQYVPDGARAWIYRRAAKKLAEAKDTSYGWKDEAVAARTLAQMGPHVPSIAFEGVYQEIAAVWCGNCWGRSDAHTILGDFVTSLNPEQKLAFARLFATNERVREELITARPKARAIELLESLRDSLVIESYRSEIETIIRRVQHRDPAC